jgi:hypothetical protein
MIFTFINSLASRGEGVRNSIFLIVYHVPGTYQILIDLLPTRVHCPHFKDDFCWVPVAHDCNPAYSGGRYQEDYGLKPVQGK